MIPQSEGLAILIKITREKAGATGRATFGLSELAHAFLDLERIAALMDPSHARPSLSQDRIALREFVSGSGQTFTEFCQRHFPPFPLGSPVQIDLVQPSAECSRLLKNAIDFASKQNAKEVTLTHLFYALNSDPTWSEKMRLSGRQTKFTPEELPVVPQNPPTYPNEAVHDGATPRLTALTSCPALSAYCTDLTLKAAHGELSECIGRRDELLRIIQNMSRVTKSAPLLIGEAGVGKTAIAEGLAWRMAYQKDPSMKGKRLLQLHLNALTSGAKMFGEFELRIQSLLKELADHPEVILFIDEIHTLVGTGPTGGPDLANHFKPALARAQFHCLGATTISEFRKHIEKDPALERRFQPILVSEPTPEEATSLLKLSFQARFEKKHNVVIAPEALQAAVDLSVHYLPDRRLPDKAVDLLDEACTQVSIPSLSATPSDSTDAPEESRRVSAAHVADVVSRWTGIPVSTLSSTEKKGLLELDDRLKKRIIGQDIACEHVARTLQHSFSGLSNRERPVGVFLFAGPSGVGKTELARTVTELLFHSSASLIRVDMSEYLEKHSISRLIGSPPGYVGFEEEGQLSSALRSRPYSVVLLDEIEKAHPDVLNIFLQVFDAGRLTTGQGKLVDARHAIFILTTNSLRLSHEKQMGFGAAPSSNAVSFDSSFLRPEMLNRFDAVITFNPLDQNCLEHIAKIKLDDLNRRLKRKGFGLEYTSAALNYLVSQSLDPSFGARPLRRMLEQEIEFEISQLLLSGSLATGHVVMIDFSAGKLIVTTFSANTE